MHANERGRGGPDRGGARALGAGRGFTLLELLVTILVVFSLMGLLVVGIRAASRTARKLGDESNVANLKLGVEAFRQQFGILPPLVNDDQSVSTQSLRVFSTTNDSDLVFLRGEGGGQRGPAWRFSTKSLGYYLLGVLGAGVDGVDGPGMLGVQRDGSFELPVAGRSGRRFEPLFDTARGGAGVSGDPENPFTTELRDRNGVAYRYYRWSPDASVTGDDIADELNVPELVGDPTADAEVRGASYAIVAAGSDRVFGDIVTEGRDAILSATGASSGAGDAELERLAREDNVVGVGR